ncbi:MAG: oligosaccharide flippase family protein [Caldilineaceae bacterium]|nr:oligosaccharide flippase family protein [Caldilineaceae bacterium]
MTNRQPARPGRRVLRNAGALTGSNLWRIGVSFGLQLLVARWLGTVALGQYTVALAWLNVAQVVSELGLQSLLVRDLAQTPHLRQGYFRLALTVQLGAAVLICLCLLGLGWLLPISSTLRLSLGLAGLTLPAYAITSVCQTFFQAGERMELVMVIEVIINTLIVGLSVLAIGLGGAVPALMGVMVITQIVSALLCLFWLQRSELLAAPQAAPAQKEPTPAPTIVWRQVAPFYGQTLADVLLQRVDILLLSMMGNPTITGIYSAAYSVVRVLWKVIQSYWRAFYPTLSRLALTQNARFRQLCRNGLHYGLVLVLLGVAVSLLLADWLLPLILGAEGAASVPAFGALIWSSPFFFIEMYAVIVLMVDHQPRLSLLLTTVHLAAVIVLLPLLAAHFGALGAAWAATAASLLGALVSVGLVWRRNLPVLR